MAYGELGPTHHSIEDLAWLRAIAEPAVVVPGRPGRDPRRRAVGGRATPDRPTCGSAALQGARLCDRERRAFVLGRAGGCADGDDVTVIADRDDGVAARSRPPSCSRRRASTLRVLNMPIVEPLDAEADLARGRSETRRHRHGRGGHRHRRPRRRGRQPASSRAPPVPMRILGDPEAVRADRQHRLPARALRADREGHRGRSTKPASVMSER